MLVHENSRVATDARIARQFNIHSISVDTARYAVSVHDGLGAVMYAKAAAKPTCAHLGRVLDDAIYRFVPSSEREHTRAALVRAARQEPHEPVQSVAFLPR